MHSNTYKLFQTYKMNLYNNYFITALFYTHVEYSLVNYTLHQLFWIAIILNNNMKFLYV